MGVKKPLLCRAGETLAGLSGPVNLEPRESEEGGGVSAQRTTWPGAQQLEGLYCLCWLSGVMAPLSHQLDCFLTELCEFGDTKVAS